MKVFLGFDDTDHHDSPYGTGKLVRWLKSALPQNCRCLGVVRQQLLVSQEIPFTSHNSSACMIAEVPAGNSLEPLIALAIDHIQSYAIDGSDPGLCVAAEKDASLTELIRFGHRCTCTVSTQQEALRAAKGVHLSGHGGTNDGIIGAAAAVGLTASGWSGRFIEYGDLRGYPDEASVAELGQAGIEVVSMDRDANCPAPHDTILTNGWLRPRLLGHRPVLFVDAHGDGKWVNLYRKRQRAKHLLVDADPLELPN
jgi:tRNA(Ile2) C34 agmatinyltransferase TiaS